MVGEKRGFVCGEEKKNYEISMREKEEYCEKLKMHTRGRKKFFALLRGGRRGKRVTHNRNKVS